MGDADARLIEQLVAASEGSNELDWLIAGSPRWEGGNPNLNVPCYTTSIDAALALVPANYFIEMRRYSDCWYICISPTSKQPALWHATQKPAALALCIAALAALKARRVN